MFVLIMLFSLLYFYAAGVTGKQINAIGQHRCDNNEHDWENCGHYYTGILSGVFWPLAIPVAMGMKSSDSIPTAISKEMKVEKKREEQLKAVKHEASLEQAELMREEMLDKRLSLTVKRGEQEKKILELNAAGVDTDKIYDTTDPEYVQPNLRRSGRYDKW